MRPRRLRGSDGPLELRDRAVLRAPNVGERRLQPLEVRADDAELVAKRDALNEAVAVARHEARATRAARDEVRRATAALEAEEARFWDDARAQDGAFDVFRERCAGLVSRAARKKDEDRTLDALAETLDKLDVDKAPFAAVDAYVRSVCKQLETKGEDRKIIGTFVPAALPEPRRALSFSVNALLLGSCPGGARAVPGTPVRAGTRTCRGRRGRRHQLDLLRLRARRHH